MHQQVTTRTIELAQAAARGDDAAAAAAAVSLARHAEVDAVKLLHCLVRDDGVVLSQRTRAAVCLLEVGGFLNGAFAPELRSSTVVGNGDGTSSRDAA